MPGLGSWPTGSPPTRTVTRSSATWKPPGWPGLTSGTPADVLAAPSVAGRDTIVEVTDGDGEKRSVVRMPYRFSEAASGPVRGVPEPGEHTDAVLRDWTRPRRLPARTD